MLAMYLQCRKYKDSLSVRSKADELFCKFRSLLVLRDGETFQQALERREIRKETQAQAISSKAKETEGTDTPDRQATPVKEESMVTDKVVDDDDVESSCEQVDTEIRLAVTNALEQLVSNVTSAAESTEIDTTQPQHKPLVEEPMIEEPSSELPSPHVTPAPDDIAQQESDTVVNSPGSSYSVHDLSPESMDTHEDEEITSGAAGDIAPPLEQEDATLDEPEQEVTAEVPEEEIDINKLIDENIQHRAAQPDLLIKEYLSLNRSSSTVTSFLDRNADELEKVESKVIEPESAAEVIEPIPKHSLAEHLKDLDTNDNDTVVVEEPVVNVDQPVTFGLVPQQEGGYQDLDSRLAQMIHGKELIIPLEEKRRHSRGSKHRHRRHRKHHGDRHHHRRKKSHDDATSESDLTNTTATEGATSEDIDDDELHNLLGV